VGEPVRCFLITPVPYVRVSLRVYESGTTTCPDKTWRYHDAMRLETARLPMAEMPTTADGCVSWDLPLDGTEKFPEQCDHCAAVLEGEGLKRMRFVEQLYQDGQGWEGTIKEALPGAMWNAEWITKSAVKSWIGPDGLSLFVRLPNGSDWGIDIPDKNGNPWTREGTPPNVTARPSIEVKGHAARAGYHGFLTDGVLTEC